MPDDSNEPRRYSLALEEARRALENQASDVASVRERTTGLVGIGGLAAAFIGGLALRDDAPVRLWTILGAAAFAALLAVAVAALWPRDFVFTQKGDVLVGWVDEYDAGLADMDRELALHMTNHYDANAGRLERLTQLYGAGLTLLLLEVILLLVDLRGR